MSTATVKAPRKKAAPVATSLPTPTSTASNKRVDLNEIDEGDIFSEISHYVYKGKNPDGRHNFYHLESKNMVNLTDKYVTELLSTADQYHSEVEVGKEDKFWTANQISQLGTNGGLIGELPRAGDLKQEGIRTIWNNIHSAQVFCVTYRTQAKPYAAKELQEKREAQFKEAFELMEKTKASKKSLMEAARLAIANVQENPILPIAEAPMRKLWGYKVQFSSINGQYDVIDMKIDPKENQKRQVNVNTIEELIFNGVKYTVK